MFLGNSPLNYELKGGLIHNSRFGADFSEEVTINAINNSARKFE